jgi:hypothetical protein
MVLNPKSSQSLVNWRQSTVISRQSAVRSSSNADYRLTTPIPVPSRTSGTVESTVVSRLSTLEPRLSTISSTNPLSQSEASLLLMVPVVQPARPVQPLLSSSACSSL